MPEAIDYGRAWAAGTGAPMEVQMTGLPERMIGAMKADVKTLTEIEADPNALVQAITVIVIAGVAALIGNIWRPGGLMGAIFGMVMSLIGYAVFALLVFVIGTKLMPEPATKATFQETFRTIGFAAAPGVFNVLQIVPFLGPVIGFFVGLWSLVIAVIATREVLDYTSTGRAIIVCIIAAAVVMFIWMMMVIVMFGAAMISQM
jgi:hypothetical protein